MPKSEKLKQAKKKKKRNKKKQAPFSSSDRNIVYVKCFNI